MSLSNRYFLVLAIILIFALSTSVAHAAGAVTIISVGLGEPDNFYSPAIGNDVVHLIVNASGANEVHANFSLIGPIECDGVHGPMLNLTASGGNWTGACNVSSAAALSNFSMHGPIIIEAINFSVGPPPTVDTSLGIGLYNMTTPPEGGPCMHWDTSATTDLSKELNFNSVNYSLAPMINISCATNHTFPSEAPYWLSNFTRLALINFTSLNMTGNTTAGQLAHLPENMDVRITPPGQFGDSRIGFNTSALAAFNATSASVTLYHLPFTSPPAIFSDAGSNGEATNVSWTNDGNLTFTVNHFSGYNVTDNVTPTISILAPTTNLTSNIIINVRVNGTMTPPSSITISGVPDGPYYYTNSTNNSAQCSNISADMETYDCVIGPIPTPDGQYNLTVIAKDYGGTSGNTNQTSFVFIKDATAPIVALISPTPSNGSYAPAVTVINVSHTEANPDKILLYIDGVLNETRSYSGSFTNFTKTFSSGAHNFSVTLNDTLNNTFSTNLTFITVDTIYPTVNFTSPTPVNGTLNTTNQTQIINVTNNDTNPSTLVFYVDGSAAQIMNWTSPFTNFSYTFTDGTHTYYVYVNDTAGNPNQTETRTVTIETTAPSASFVSPTPGNGSFVNAPAVVINVSHTEANPDKILLYIDGVLNETRSYSGNFTNFTKTFTQGAHNFSVTLNDTANNTFNTNLTFITVDSIYPTVAFTSPTPGNNTLNTTNVQTINVTHTETNPDKILLYIDGLLNETRNYSGAFTNFTKTFADGAHNFSVWLNDSAGNTNTTGTYFITIDSVVPQVTANPSTYPAGQTYAKVGDVVRLNITATDVDGSGVKNATATGTGASQACGGDVTLTNTGGNFWTGNCTIAGSAPEGSSTPSVYVYDNAGNLNNSAIVNILVDKTAPTVAFASPTPGNNTLKTNQTQIINITHNDTNQNTLVLYIDGVLNETRAYTGNFTNFTKTFTEGTHNFSVVVNDSAGNTNTTGTSFVTIDSIAPAVTINTPTANSWYKKVNVTINATITDMSSLSKNQYKITNSTGGLVPNWTNLTSSSGYYVATFDATSATEGNYTLQINATDNNSLVNDSVTSLFWIDGTAPNITSFSLSATTAYTGDTITGTCAATDNLDTNVSTAVTGISTSTSGTKIATCTATDDAGNSVTSNLSYTINAQSTGDGGGGGAPTPQATQTFASVATGATATMPVAVTGLAVSQIAITVENAATSVQVHIESVTTPANGTPTLAIAGETGAVYSYMQITTTNLPNSNIASAKIRFTVSKSWLTQQGLNASDVSLFRLSGDWTQLTTTVLSEDADNVYFEATTPGFSLFAVFASAPVTPTQFCVPNSKQCSGNNLQACNVGGTAWQTTETCAYGCNTTTLACDAAPAALCTPASKRCSGSDLQTCNADGTAWQTTEACTYGCDATALACNTSPPPTPTMPLETVAAIIVVLVIIGGFVYYKFFMSHGYHYKR